MPLAPGKPLSPTMPLIPGNPLSPGKPLSPVVPAPVKDAAYSLPPDRAITDNGEDKVSSPDASTSGVLITKLVADRVECTVIWFELPSAVNIDPAGPASTATPASFEERYTVFVAFPEKDITATPGIT